MDVRAADIKIKGAGSTKDLGIKARVCRHFINGLRCRLKLSRSGMKRRE